MADDIVYKVSLDDDDILKSLRAIDKSIEKLANNASKDFQKIDKASNLSSFKIGAVSGVVSSLTTEFINLGKQAVQSLINISKEAVNIASGYETLEARLLGIFQGNAQAADEAFDFIQKRSRELGTDLTELAGAFLPQVENLDQFERVAKIATALARSDPEQGAIGARIALIEALSGTFTSLQRRFEIPAAEIDRLKEAFDAEGIEGFLSTLETVLTESGKSFEDLAGTAQASFSRVQIQGEQLLGVLGQPVLEELKQQFDDIGSILSERSDDFELIATAVGQLVANVIDFIGTSFADFLRNLDTQQVLEIVDDFQGIVESARNLAEVLGLFELPQALLDNVGFLAESLNTALVTAAQLSVLAKAEVAARQADEAKRAEQGLTALGGFVSFAGTEEQQLEQQRAAQEARNEVYREAITIFEENKQITDSYRTSLDEFAQSQENAGDKTTQTADAILQQRQAAKEAAAAISEELQKALEKERKLAQDYVEDIVDIRRKAGQKTVDTEQEFIEKRLDQARSFLRSIEDIERKNAQAIEDSGRDLRRDEADALKDFNRDRAELEKDSAKERIKIEEDYRDELRKIQTNFEDDADEAARNRDAVTFFRLQRQRDRQIEEAKTTRTKRVDEARTEAQQRREELQRSYEENLEDARLADSRRLEDLQIRLDREFEAARLNNERELQDLLTSEERKRAELKTSLDRQLEEARIANNRRVEDFKESLDKEVAAQLEAEKKKTEIVRKQNEERRQLDRQRQSTLDRFQETGRTSRLGGRAAGGPVGAGQTVAVGERGPEIFRPSVAGNVIPLSPGITSPLAATNIANTVNNINNASVSQSFGGGQDAMTRRIAENAAADFIRRVLGG